jgi:putative DNA primase/helicase
MEGWQTHCLAATPETIASWRHRYPDSTNTSILCGAIIGCDNDVLEPEVAAQLEELRLRTFGSTPLCRIGRAPKMMSLYRAETPHGKMQTPPFCFDENLHDKDAWGKVEVLAKGEQLIAYGVHPQTRAPYTWLDHSPLDTPASDLPVVTLEQVKHYIEEAGRIIRAAGGRTKEEIEGKREGEGNAAAGTKRGEKPSYDKVASALDHVSPDDLHDRIEWVRVGYAVYHALGEGGRDLFLNWCKRWSGYTAGMDAETLGQWRSFAKGRSVSDRTLFWYASRNGWWWNDAAGAKGEGERPKGKTEGSSEQHSWDDPDISILDNRRGDLPDLPRADIARRWCSS